MNLAQLRIQIDRRTGRAQDVPAANAYINEALNTITNRREWPWLDASQSITITTALTYALPDDWTETRVITINGCEARRIYIADGDDMQAFDDWNENYVYTIEGGLLQFFPQPAEGFVALHRYVRSEPLLSADVATPLLPERYHSVLADLAAALFLERVDPTRADRYLDRYEKGQRQMLEAVQRAASPSRVRVRPGAWY